jgi:hypothetical protein
MMFAITTVCLAEELYWVVGNRATNKCEIATSNPRSTIRARPKPPDERTDQRLVQDTVAAHAVSHRRIDLLKFGLQMLVDQ